MGNDWWCLKSTSVNMVKASNILSHLITTYPLDRLAKYFKALAHPTRILMVALMIDGRPYTKEDIYLIISRFGVRTSLMSIDRHVRTLEAYEVIKPYAPVRRDCRGRRPYAYVIREDAMEFLKSILTYLITLEPYLSDKVAPRIVISRLGINIVRKAKLACYLSGSINEYVLKYINYLMSVVNSKLAPLVMTKVPTPNLMTCSEAKDFLTVISRTPYIRLINDERLRRIINSAAVTTSSPSKCLPKGGKGHVNEVIKELVNRLNEDCECCDLIVIIANSIRTYLLSNRGP